MKNWMSHLCVSGIFVSFVLGPCATFAGTEETTKTVSDLHATDSTKNVPMILRKYTSDETGVVFDCDPSWKVNRQGKTIKVTISETPRVEMVIEESDQALHFMSELNEEAFASMGRYEDGFHFEHLTRCGRETIKINGYLKGSPQTRVSDFYLIDHLHLHSVKFTVDPKEAWDDYKWIIKGIVDSVCFIKHKPVVKFNLEPTEETCEEPTP